MQAWKGLLEVFAFGMATSKKIKESGNECLSRSENVQALFEIYSSRFLGTQDTGHRAHGHTRMRETEKRLSPPGTEKRKNV